MLDNQRKKIKKVVKGLTNASRSHKKQANTLKKVLKKANAKRTYK